MTTESQSIGTARVDIVVDHTKAEAGVESMRQRLTSFTTEAQKQYAALSATERRRVDSLIKQAETLGMTRAEQIAYNAQLRTSGPLLDEINRKLAVNAARAQVSSQQFNSLGMSSKQTQAALRGVPAQLTDIVTALQGGQNPLTVFLQQGGQLRDMFGGFVPAGRALLGTLSGLINPLTILGGASAALFVAWKQGEEQTEAFNRALIQTGNYADTTAERLGDLAQEMDNLDGVTTRSASAALAQVVATGRFTGEQLQMVAMSAELMRVTTGKAIDETIAEFERIAKDPVDAILELNSKYHFLTQSQLDQIQSLEDQGRAQEAVTEAMRVYANTIGERAPEMAANLDTISKSLNWIKTGAADAWDAVVGGMQRADRQAKEGLSSLSQFLTRLTQFQGASGGAAPFAFMAGFGGVTVPAKAAPRASAVDSAAAKKAIEDRKKAQEEFDRLAVSNLSKREKLEREISEIKQLGVKAGKNQAAIDEQIAAARARYAESEAKSRKKKETDPTEALLARIRQQVALNEEQAKSEDTLTTSERLRVQVQEELERIGGKVTAGRRQEIAAALEQLQATDALATAQKNETKLKQDLLRLNAQLQATEDNRRAANEIELMQYGRGSDALLFARRRLDIEREYTDGLKQLRDRGVAEDSESWKVQEQALRDSRDRMLTDEASFFEQRATMMGDWKNGALAALEDFAAASANVAGRVYDGITSAAGALEQSIARSLRKGKLDLTDFLETVGDELAKFYARQAVQGLLNLVTGFFTGGATAGSSWGQANGIGAPIQVGGATVNAKGGVYDSPSLSRYSNGVYNTPQFFKFAKGGVGVFGEAGEEAIMPLRRGKDGKLGVVAAGGGGTPSIEVNVTKIGNGDGEPTVELLQKHGKMIVNIALNEATRQLATRGSPMNNAMKEGLNAGAQHG